MSLWSFVDAQVVSGAVGGATVLSILAVALRQAYSQRTAGAAIYIQARKDARREASDEVARLRKDFEDRLQLEREAVREELSGLHADIATLNRALTDILQLVAAEHRPEAMRILVSLGVRSNVFHGGAYPPPTGNRTRDESDG